MKKVDKSYKIRVQGKLEGKIKAVVDMCSEGGIKRCGPLVGNTKGLVVVGLFITPNGINCNLNEGFAWFDSNLPDHEVITLDDFIRKFGEPSEIKAWFGEEGEIVIDKKYQISVTPEQSREIQELVFSHGWVWNGTGDTEVSCTNSKYLNVYEDKIITHSDASPSTNITAEDFIAKFSKKKPQKNSIDFYPNWEQLTPLPDKPRPWAKKRERYVCVDEIRYDSETFPPGTITEITEDGDYYGSQYFKTKAYGITNVTRLAKIPGETYAEEPEEPEKGPEREICVDEAKDNGDATTISWHMYEGTTEKVLTNVPSSDTLRAQPQGDEIILSMDEVIAIPNDKI